MKTIIFLLFSGIATFVSAQKTLYFRQKVAQINSEIIGAYPITLSEAKGNKHVQFAYDAKGKLMSIKEFKQNVFDYSDQSAIKNYFLKSVYVLDTMYQIQIGTLDVLAMTDKQLIEGATKAELTGNKVVFKAGKVHKSYNLQSYYYAKNYSGAPEEVTYDIEGNEMEPQDTPPVVDEDRAKENEEAINNIPVAYEFEYAGNTTSLFFINLENTRINIEEIYSLKLIDDIAKNTQEVQYFDKDNKRVTVSGAYSNQLGFNKEKMQTYTLQLDEEGNLKSEGDEAVNYAVLVEYDKNGYPAKYVNCDKNLKPIEASYTSYQEDPETYEQVEVKELRQTEIRYINDVNGNILEQSTYDVNGVLKNFDLDYATKKCTFDKNGNQTSERFYDSKGALMINVDNAGSLTTYSDDNKIISTTGIGEDDKPMVNSSGIVTTKYTYNAETVATTSYFDANGDPMADVSGAHKYELTNDEVQGADDAMYQRNMVYDIDGKVIGFENIRDTYSEEDNYNISRQTFDEKNRIVSKKNYDLNHFPMGDEYSPHAIKYVYFSADEIPGFAEDNQGTAKSIAYFDTDGKPTNFSEGYHRQDKTLEMKGSNYITTTRYSNAEGVLTDIEQGAIYIEETSVEPGVYSSYAWMNSKNEAVVDGLGIWKTVNEITSDGTATSFFNKENKPTVNDLKAHKIIETMDQTSSNYSYYNLKGKLANNAKGYAIEKTVRDENYSVLNQAYYSRKNKPAINKDFGFHKMLLTYDEMGNNTSVTLLNKKSKLVDAKCYLWDAYVKAAKMTRVYTPTEEGYDQIDTQYFDAKGKVIDVQSGQ